MQETSSHQSTISSSFFLSSLCPHIHSLSSLDFSSFIPLILASSSNFHSYSLNTFLSISVHPPLIILSSSSSHHQNHHQIVLSKQCTVFTRLSFVRTYKKNTSAVTLLPCLPIQHRIKSKTSHHIITLLVSCNKDRCYLSPTIYYR